MPAVYGRVRLPIPRPVRRCWSVGCVCGGAAPAGSFAAHRVDLVPFVTDTDRLARHPTDRRIASIGFMLIFTQFTFRFYVDIHPNRTQIHVVT